MNRQQKLRSLRSQLVLASAEAKRNRSYRSSIFHRQRYLELYDRYNALLLECNT